MEEIITAVAIGIGIGFLIFHRRKSRADAPNKEKILAMLQEHGSLALPEIVTSLGLKDGLINRGKIMSIINPLVASGELAQEEPPGTTVRNRLEVLRFSIKK